MRRDEATAIIADALRAGSDWVDFESCGRLLDCYGMPRVAQAFASEPAEVGAQVERLGGRVAVKAVSPGLVHKSDVGAVRTGLQGATEAAGAAALMQADVARAGYAVEGFVVQEMAPPGVEMLVGVVQDPTFGPIVACGAGGVAAELIGDTAVRLTPLSQAEAGEMVRSLRAYPMLAGYRGGPHVDVAALEDVLLRVGALADAHPEIVEMDCNPVIISPDGARVVDARLRIEPAAPPPPLPSLGM